MSDSTAAWLTISIVVAGPLLGMAIGILLARLFPFVRHFPPDQKDPS